jgi:hypothetical protein
MSKILCVLYAVDVIQSHLPEMRFQISTNIPVAKPCQIRNISISTQGYSWEVLLASLA